MVLFSLLGCGWTLAGSIRLRWDRVAGATGYTVFYGTQSGVYDHSVAVSNVDRTEINGLPNCTDLFVAVKARNQFGESPEFSNEVSGWSRPRVDDHMPRQIKQGEQSLLELEGHNFRPGATLELEFTDPPTDIQGQTLFRVDSAAVVSCDRIQALVSAEPGARGLRAAPVGPLALRFRVRNPELVFGRSPLTDIEILFDEDRRDINRSDDSTRDRVDGSDLTWLAFSFGYGEGDGRFSPDADLDGNGQVDGTDLALLASGFGFCRSADTWSDEACG